MDPETELRQVSANVIDGCAAVGDTQINLNQSPASEGMSQEQPGDAFIGKTILEHYEIVSLIGSGGMSVVYKAHHLILNQYVAIKMLHPQLARDHSALLRFRQEAQSASRLDHENIVHIREFGVLPDQTPFLIMDLIEGVSLSELLSRGKLPLERALSICIKICRALAHAHAKGVVHRDIKPSNVIVINENQADESIKLIDFGIAKVIFDDTNEGIQRLTVTGESLGSPPYMSPEQCQGTPLDARADIYSTGCVLYELLCGQPPFTGTSMFAIIHAHVVSLPESISKLRPDIPHAQRLDDIILTAMSKEPESRYESAEAFEEALSSALNDLHKRDPLLILRPLLNVYGKRMRQRRDLLLPIIAGLVVILALGALLHFENVQRTAAIRAATDAAQPLVTGLDAFAQSYAIGKAYFQGGDYSAAQTSFERALLHAEAIGQENEDYQRCLERLATCYTKNGQPIAALKAQQDLKRIRTYNKPLGTIAENNDKISNLNSKSTLTEQEKITLAETLTKQATLYSLEHKLDLSIETSQAAYSAASRAAGAESPLSAEAMSVLSGALIANEQYTKAAALIAQMRKIAQQPGPQHDALLADATFRQAELQHAQVFNDRKKIVNQTDIDASQTESWSSTQLAGLKAAAAQYKEAAQLYEKTMGPMNPKRARALTHLADAYLRLSDWKQADSTAAEALKVQQTVRGNGSVQAAAVLYLQAQIKIREAGHAGNEAIASGDYRQAQRRLMQASAIYEQRSSDIENSLHYGETLNLLGFVEEKLGNFEKAEKCYKTGINVASNWNKDCWTARTAYQRLIKLYQTWPRLSAQERTKLMSDAMAIVQNFASISQPVKKGMDDLNKPIGDK